MNKLSWFLYAVDSLGTLGDTLGLLSISGLIIISGLSVPMLTGDDWAEYKKLFYSSLVVFLLMGLISIAIPSKQTMYLIAASELSESAITSDIGQQALELIKSKLEVNHE